MRLSERIERKALAPQQGGPDTWQALVDSARALEAQVAHYAELMGAQDRGADSVAAAAPDLLVACEAAWDAFGAMDWALGSDAITALNAIEDAIARARGEVAK